VKGDVVQLRRTIEVADIGALKESVQAIHKLLQEGRRGSSGGGGEGASEGGASFRKSRWASSEEANELNEQEFYKDMVENDANLSTMITEIRDAEDTSKELKPSPFVMRPQGRFRSLWDILMFLLTLFSSVMVPLNLAFLAVLAPTYGGSTSSTAASSRSSRTAA
jgi:hypothetical protein